MSKSITCFAFLGILTLLGACSPTVKVEAPDKPIVVDLNIKIDQTLRVQIEKDLEKEIAKNPDIF